jgi:hypothetical protein
MLAPPPRSQNADYIECPHCLRRFNQTAGERHIPKCKDTVNKPKPPPGLRNNAQPMGVGRQGGPGMGGMQQQRNRRF